jgi:hypothetical protein
MSTRWAIKSAHYMWTRLPNNMIINFIIIIIIIIITMC